MSAVGKLSEADIDYINGKMCASGLRGEIVHLYGVQYALRHNGEFTHWFYYSSMYVIFHEMKRLYKNYYTLRIDKEFWNWYNSDTKKGCVIYVDDYETVFDNGLMVKFIKILEKYNLSIEKYAFCLNSHYNKIDSSMCVMIRTEISFLFAHLYADERNSFDTIVDYSLPIAAHFSNIASMNVENTEKIFGCCQLMERLLKSKNIEFPFPPEKLTKISFSNQIYNFHYGDKIFKLKISDDALVMVGKENNNIRTSSELVQVHLQQLWKFIYTHQDQYDITLPKEFNTVTAYNYIYRLCASRGYGFKQVNGQYDIMTYTGKSNVESNVESDVESNVRNWNVESNVKSDVEFGAFLTAEKASLRLIMYRLDTITAHTQNNLLQNTLILRNMHREQNSIIFMEWFKHFCKETGYTYKVLDEDTISITLFP